MWRKRNIDLGPGCVFHHSRATKEARLKICFLTWAKATLVSHELDFSTPTTALWLVQQWMHSGIRESSKATLRWLPKSVHWAFKNMLKPLFRPFQQVTRASHVMTTLVTDTAEEHSMINQYDTGSSMHAMVWWVSRCPSVRACDDFTWMIQQKDGKGLVFQVSCAISSNIPHWAALSTSKSESKTSNDPQSMQMVQEWSAKKLFMSNLVVCGCYSASYCQLFCTSTCCSLWPCAVSAW